MRIESAPRTSRAGNSRFPGVARARARGRIKGARAALAQPRRLFYVKRIPAASAKSGATAGEKTIVRLPRTGSGNSVDGN